MTRITGSVTRLDEAQVQAFFDRRSQKLQALGPLATTMYQTEELARRRDQWEKTTITPLLHVGPESRILDIGCGTGRWAQALAPSAKAYLGVDFCVAYVDACRAVLGSSALANDSHRAQLLRAQDVAAGVLEVPPPFTHVIIAGVLTFLNDDDVSALFNRLPSMCSSDAVLYLREPVGLEARLTLKEEHSTELEDVYHAIYRPASYYRDAILHGFENVQVIHDDLLFPRELNNRAETAQHVFVVRGKIDGPAGAGERESASRNDVPLRR